MLGRTLSHYRILSKLGEGGMGEVYLAEDQRLDRKVALKILPAEMSTDRERLRLFEREAKAIAALNHPNIVTIYSVEEADGLQFLTLEWVQGKTLVRLLKEGGPLAPGPLLKIAIPLADALRVAHQEGITHRDLKPANVMVSESDIVKVLDFGLAIRSEPDLSQEDITQTMTHLGMVVGTVPYMSPEQLLGRVVDPRSDLFSFGVVLFELATGRRPFVADDVAELVASILRDPPAPLASHLQEPQSSGNWEPLEPILKHCLEKKPEQRIPNAEVLHAELMAWQVSLRGMSHQRVASESLSWSGPLGSDSSSSGFLSPEAQGRPSIAVLAFSDLSPRKSEEYFCEGLAEELINALAQVGDLRVVARTSAFSFKDEDQDLTEIARRLQVETILQGSVRKAGNRLRITTQLVAGQDGSLLWSERFDREMDDVFAIQDEITSAVVGQLKIELLGEAEDAVLRRRHTENLDAYHLYLKGRHFWNKRTPQDLVNSIRCFEEALAKDSGYALAHAGVADSYTILGYYSACRPAEAFPKAKAAARRALEIDDSLAEAHSSLAFSTLLYDWDWQEAGKGFRRSLELNSGYATAHHWYAEYLVWTGQAKEAMVEARKALELDPLSLIINTLMGWVHFYSRRNSRAITRLERTLEMDPSFVPAQFWLAQAYAQAHEPGQALAVLENGLASSAESPMLLAALGNLYAASGKTKKAEKMLETIRLAAERTYVPPYFTAALYVGFRDETRVFEWLTRACQERDNWMVFLEVDPLWDDYRSDPRFEKLLSEVGFHVQ